MTREEFAIFNCMNQKETDQILDWFVENFNEKDSEKVADILIDAIKKSLATINDFQIACSEIKKIFPDYDDITIIEELGEIANYGIRGKNIKGLLLLYAEKSQIVSAIQKSLKKLNHENLS